MDFVRADNRVLREEPGEFHLTQEKISPLLMNSEVNNDDIQRTSPDFDLKKVHKVLEWAVKDISGVSISEIEIKANIQLYDTLNLIIT